MEHLKPFPSSNKNAPLHVKLGGITYKDPTYRMERESSQFFVIEYISAGEGYVFADGKLHHVGAGEIYLLYEGERHLYYADPQNPFEKIFLNVEGPLCERLISSYRLLGRHFFDGEGLFPCFQKILETIDSTKSDEYMQARLQGVFLEILCRLYSMDEEAAHSEEALKMRRHIDRNPARMISVAELGRIIFRSADYCNKLFKREFGMTPYAYQLDRKIHTAKTLLSSTGMSVTEISESLGYSDMHYFSNLFKSKCGMRPLEYRKIKNKK